MVFMFFLAQACEKNDEEEDPRGLDLMENEDNGGTGGGGGSGGDCGGCDNSITIEECDSAVEILYGCGGFFVGPDGNGLTEGQAYDLCEAASNLLACAFLCIEENGNDCEIILACTAENCPQEE